MITAETVPFSGSVERSRWTSLNSQSVVSTAFSTEAYLSALVEVTGLPGEITFLLNDGRDIAGLVSLRTRSGPLNRLLPSPLTAFSAFAAEALPTPADVHAHSSWLDTLSEALISRYSTVDLMLPPVFLDVRALQWLGWSASPLYTYQLLISDEESIRSGWSESTSRLFRKHREKFVLRSDHKDIAEIVSLCRAGYERHHKNAPLSNEQMIRFAELLSESGKAQCWSISEMGSNGISAGIVLLRHEKTAVYWIAGSRPGPGMTVLIGLLVSELNKEGASVLDFVGANTPAIAEFKRRFSPELTQYFRVRHTRSGILKILQSAVRVLRG